MARLREKRQHLAKLQPAVGIKAPGSGQCPGVQKVTITHVIGGKRHPRSVAAGYLRGQAFQQQPQIAGTSHDALAGIASVLDAELAGRHPRQHHHAAHTGGTDGGGIPMRFLVALGGQQRPGQAGGPAGLLEQRPEFRQPPGDPLPV